MTPELRVLTLQHYGETPEEDQRVTLSAISIKMVAAQLGTMQGRPVNLTSILFLDSDPVNLVLNDIDLRQLESVVGTYGFYEE